MNTVELAVRDGIPSTRSTSPIRRPTPTSHRSVRRISPWMVENVAAVAGRSRAKPAAARELARDVARSRLLAGRHLMAKPSFTIGIAGGVPGHRSRDVRAEVAHPGDVCAGRVAAQVRDQARDAPRPGHGDRHAEICSNMQPARREVTRLRSEIMPSRAPTACASPPPARTRSRIRPNRGDHAPRARYTPAGPGLADGGPGERHLPASTCSLVGRRGTHPDHERRASTSAAHLRHVGELAVAGAAPTRAGRVTAPRSCEHFHVYPASPNSCRKVGRLSGVPEHADRDGLHPGPAKKPGGTSARVVPSSFPRSSSASATCRCASTRRSVWPRCSKRVTYKLWKLYDRNLGWRLYRALAERSTNI